MFRVPGASFPAPDLSGLPMHQWAGNDLLALLCDAVLASYGPEAGFAWDESLHPRDAKGRFATGHGDHAVRQYSKGKIRDMVSARRVVTGDHAAEIAKHLNNLTVAEIHELKKEMGLKASGKDKAALVAKLALRLAAARVQGPAPGEKSAEKQPSAIDDKSSPGYNPSGGGTQPPEGKKMDPVKVGERYTRQVDEPDGNGGFRQVKRVYTVTRGDDRPDAPRRSIEVEFFDPVMRQQRVILIPRTTFDAEYKREA